MPSVTPWSSLDPLRKKRMIYKIHKVLSKYMKKTDGKQLLKSVFTKKFDHGLYERSNDHFSKSAIVENIVKELARLKKNEHQSGAFQALLSACCGSNMSASALARLLKVHRSSVRQVCFNFQNFYFTRMNNNLQAMKWRLARDTSMVYRKILRKPVIKRVRKAPQLDQACKDFLESAFTPSRYPPSPTPFFN